jgi:hypothetical protein
MLQYLVIVGAVLSMVACFSYIRSMFKGEAKPNRVSWLMWAIAPMIATAAGLSNGVRWAVLPVFMSGFSPLLIFLFSFVSKKAYWKLELFDYICGGCSVIALILWAITKNANLAIVFAIISDGSAAIPTIIKSWTNPETEIIFPFLAGIFSAIAAFFAIQTWVFSAYAFPFYLIVINAVLLFAINREKF